MTIEAGHIERVSLVLTIEAGDVEWTSPVLTLEAADIDGITGRHEHDTRAMTIEADGIDVGTSSLRRSAAAGLRLRISPHVSRGHRPPKAVAAGTALQNVNGPLAL